MHEAQAERRVEERGAGELDALAVGRVHQVAGLAHRRRPDVAFVEDVDESLALDRQHGVVAIGGAHDLAAGRAHVGPSDGAGDRDPHLSGQRERGVRDGVLLLDGDDGLVHGELDQRVALAGVDDRAARLLVLGGVELDRLHASGHLVEHGLAPDPLLQRLDEPRREAVREQAVRARVHDPHHLAVTDDRVGGGGGLLDPHGDGLAAVRPEAPMEAGRQDAPEAQARKVGKPQLAGIAVEQILQGGDAHRVQHQ